MSQNQNSNLFKFIYFLNYFRFSINILDFFLRNLKFGISFRIFGYFGYYFGYSGNFSFLKLLGKKNAAEKALRERYKMLLDSGGGNGSATVFKFTPLGVISL